MSESLEHQLDLTMDMRRQRHRQHEAELAQAEKAIRDGHLELERRQTRFSTEVRSLIRDVVEQANRHLATRRENCQICEVSGYFTGPLYIGGTACNPIAYELLVDGQNEGETLIVELTHDGMIEAFLGPFRPSVPEAHTARIDIGWRPIPLARFNAKAAAELVIRYLGAITTRRPLGGRSAGEMMRTAECTIPA